MKKYQIVSPNGINVCIIEAQEVKYYQMNSNDIPCTVIFKDDKIAFELSPDWAVIPVDIIFKEEINFEQTIGYLKSGVFYYKHRMDELAKSDDVLDVDRLQKMHGEVEEMSRAIKYLNGWK